MKTNKKVSLIRQNSPVTIKPEEFNQNLTQVKSSQSVHQGVGVVDKKKVQKSAPVKPSCIKVKDNGNKNNNIQSISPKPDDTNNKNSTTHILKSIVAPEYAYDTNLVEVSAIAIQSDDVPLTSTGNSHIINKSIYDKAHQEIHPLPLKSSHSLITNPRKEYKKKLENLKDNFDKTVSPKISSKSKKITKRVSVKKQKSKTPIVECQDEVIAISDLKCEDLVEEDFTFNPLLATIPNKRGRKPKSQKINKVMQDQNSATVSPAFDISAKLEKSPKFTTPIKNNVTQEISFDSPFEDQDADMPLQICEKPQNSSPKILKGITQGESLIMLKEIPSLSQIKSVDQSSFYPQNTSNKEKKTPFIVDTVPKTRQNAETITDSHYPIIFISALPLREDEMSFTHITCIHHLYTSANHPGRRRVRVTTAKFLKDKKHMQSVIGEESLFMEDLIQCVTPQIYYEFIIKNLDNQNNSKMLK